MNETECANLIESVQWTEPGRLVSLAILEFINVLVIVGNCLVIAAVFCSNKLRSVTNFFIVNLAVADLLVGLAVLPFSATWEVFKVWIFGDLWCRVWLAVDVWMCTASILNLCAISLDRYVAVTRPVSYPSIMSTKRAKSLIAGIWVLSFVICFPPLVGWKEQKPEVDTTYNRGNHTLFYAVTSPPPSPPPPCPWKCELTNDWGYVLYSALGSFYIPMFVMLFFYWRIYRAAVRTTRAINQGFKTTKGSGSGSKGQFGPRLDETRLTLRIHRGRPSKPTAEQSESASLNMPDHFDELSTPPRRAASDKTNRRRHEKVAITVSYASSDNMSEASSPPPYTPLLAQNNSKSTTAGAPSASVASVTSGPAAKNGRTSFKTKILENKDKIFNLDNASETSKSCDSVSPSPKSKKQRNTPKRNNKIQAKRFRMETKAAKTLAIIVGGFIFCWLPFFTTYLIRAFCPECIPDLAFSCFFWLGYCNSAINPVIYALFSNEFRLAFKRILFRCVCTRDAYRASENFQLMAARTCLAPVNFHKTISGCTEQDDLDGYS